MKSLFNQFPTKIIPLLLMAGIMSACTLGDFSDEIDNQELTAEEIEAASQIMGQALSDDNDGVFSSLNDALSTVTSTGFESDSRFKGHDDDDDDHGRDDYSGRGGERNYEYSYDPDTGTHTLSFEREVIKDEFQKSMSAVLT